MNDNENRFDGLGEEQASPAESPKEDFSEPSFSFDFPKPPVYPAAEEKKEDVFS